MKLQVLLLSAVAVILCSCSTTFNLEKAEQDVLNQGYQLRHKHTDETELDELERQLINQMKAFDKYEVDELNITYASQYDKGEFTSSEYRSVLFFTFESKKYADLYYYWSLNYRSEDTLWRVAQKGNIIVDTSDETLHEIIGLKFK